MIVIVGLVVLLVAVIIGITGVLAHAGVAHPLTGKFEVLGYHVTGVDRHAIPGRDRDRRAAMLGLSVLRSRGQQPTGDGRRS